MLLEFDAQAPIPQVDACACCMAAGTSADLRIVRCHARSPEDKSQAAVFVRLPMCAVCRKQNQRFQNVMTTTAFISLGAAIVAAIIGLLMSGIVTALVVGFLAFILALLAGMGIFRMQRHGLIHHAPDCRPLTTGEEITSLGGGGSKRYGVSKQYAVEFGNDNFAKRLLSKASAHIRLPGSWSSVGILFDIDALKRAAGIQFGEYGRQARLIFMQLFDPEVIGSAFVFHGDTAATLAGKEKHWCIAVAVKDIAAVELIVKAFTASSEQGLAPVQERFVHHPRDVMLANGSLKALGAEPLTLWFTTDGDGTIMLPDPPEQEDIDLCVKCKRPWKIAKSHTV